MTSVEKLLNKISDFRCTVEGEETSFCGMLQVENRNVVLNAKFPIEQYRKLPSGAEFTVLGSVSGTETTLVRCRIRSAKFNYGASFAALTMTPTEIIVGGCFDPLPEVKSVTVSTPALNYMFFGESPLEPNCFFSKDDPSVLKCTFPEPIRANDKYGTISLRQVFGAQRTVGGWTHNVESLVEYSFTSPMPLMEAFTKTAAARSLFSFFGNGYVPFGQVSFRLDDDDCSYGLHLNYTEDVQAVDEPFLVTTSEFGDQFQTIWDSWLELYESASPIPTLFYEIVCNRSTRINSFLNLSQAIEVYSNVYRDAQAKQMARSDPNNKKGVKLKHRYQDILSAYNGALGLDEASIGDYAQSLASMRNYYTHYNVKRYIEPTFDELFSAIHILRFVLLTIVYASVGLPLDQIRECRQRAIFSRFDEDAEAVLGYSKR